MQDWVAFWRQVLKAEATNWVVFEQGTCILGTEILAYHRLCYDAPGEQGDVIRHSGGYLYVQGSVCNWVSHQEGEERQTIIERALEQRSADRRSKRKVWVQSDPSRLEEQRVADLVIKTARDEQVQELKLQTNERAGEVSFLRGHSWVTVMQPPLRVMSDLIRYFDQAAREREDLQIAWHEGPCGPWAQLTLLSVSEGPG